MKENDFSRPDLGTALRDLGDDRGRPLTPTADILAAGQRTRRRRRVSVVAGVAAACVALAVAVPALGMGLGPDVSTLSPADQVRRIAAAVPDEDPMAGHRYWKITRKVRLPENPEVADPSKPGGAPDVRSAGRRSWTTFVESTWNDPQTRHAQYEGTGVELVAEVDSEDGLGFPTSLTVGGFNRTWETIRELPAEPAALRDTILRERDPERAATPGDAPLVAGDVMVLLTTPVKPAVRRGLLQLLADAPGMTVEGRVRDSEGRSGTAVDLRETEEGFTMVTRLILSDDGDLLEVSNFADPASTFPPGTTAWEWGTADDPHARFAFLFLGGVDELR